MSTSPRAHWDAVYREKAAAQTSWFRAHLETSLRLIDALCLPAAAPLIDVGGGRSTLVDDWLERGFADITVLDLAQPALDDARRRVGADAGRVQWLAADVTQARLPAAHYALWHDRAVFHFLVDAAGRSRYVAQAAAAVRAGGHAIVAAFAPDGPESCSGLPVRRYDADALAVEFEAAFDRTETASERHLTPWGSIQPFTYVVLRRKGQPSQ